MERETIDAVVRQLRPGPFGWRCELPNQSRFFDQPVGLTLDTRAVRYDSPPPVLAPAEAELVRLILGGLLCILAECERQYRQYCSELPRPLSKAHKPRIWVSREWLGPTPPGDWSFVVGILGVSGWCVHSEFNGFVFKRIWSSD